MLTVFQLTIIEKLQFSSHFIFNSMPGSRTDGVHYQVSAVPLPADKLAQYAGMALQFEVFSPPVYYNLCMCARVGLPLCQYFTFKCFLTVCCVPFRHSWNGPLCVQPFTFGNAPEDELVSFETCNVDFLHIILELYDEEFTIFVCRQIYRTNENAPFAGWLVSQLG